MNNIVQRSLWDSEPAEQEETKRYTWGDYVEQTTRYADVDADAYNTPERLQKLADFIGHEKYHPVEMQDQTGKRVWALVTIQGACVDGNYVRYWGILTEPCTIYGEPSRYGRAKDEEEDLNEYE